MRIEGEIEPAKRLAEVLGVEGSTKLLKSALLFDWPTFSGAPLTAKRKLWLRL